MAGFSKVSNAPEGFPDLGPPTSSMWSLTKQPAPGELLVIVQRSHFNLCDADASRAAITSDPDAAAALVFDALRRGDRAVDLRLEGAKSPAAVLFVARLDALVQGDRNVLARVAKGGLESAPPEQGYRKDDWNNYELGAKIVDRARLASTGMKSKGAQEAFHEAGSAISEAQTTLARAALKAADAAAGGRGMPEGGAPSKEPWSPGNDGRTAAEGRAPAPAADIPVLGGDGERTKAAMAAGIGGRHA